MGRSARQADCETMIPAHLRKPRAMVLHCRQLAARANAVSNAAIRAAWQAEYGRDETDDERERLFALLAELYDGRPLSVRVLARTMKGVSNV